MCFSATASFGASAFLAGAGIVAIKKIESPKMLAFASMPILFGVQQFSEGILWLTFADPEFVFWQKPAIYGFLLIAQVLWPVWLPFALWRMEPDDARKKIMTYFFGIGAVLSLFLLYCLIFYEVRAVEEARHIRYSLDFPYKPMKRIMYFLAIVVPIFLSSLRFMKLLGVTLLGSLMLSYILYYNYVISVWCFFAAILSALVVLIIVNNRDPRVPSSPT